MELVVTETISKIGAEGGPTKKKTPQNKCSWWRSKINETQKNTNQE